MPLPRALARFNRRITNHVLGPLAHVTPPFTIVCHRGRRTGNDYRTPVWAFRTATGFVIPLTYGGEPTEWVKNVLASDGAKLVRAAGTYAAVAPQVVHGDAGLRAVPVVVRPALRALRVDDYLVLDARETE